MKSKFPDGKDAWYEFTEQIVFNIPSEYNVPQTETLGEVLHWVYNSLSIEKNVQGTNDFLTALLNFLQTVPFQKHHDIPNLFYEILLFIEKIKPHRSRASLLKLLFASERQQLLSQLTIHDQCLLDYLVSVVIRTGVDEEYPVESFINSRYCEERPIYSYLSILYYCKHMNGAKALETFASVFYSLMHNFASELWNLHFYYALLALEDEGKFLIRYFDFYSILKNHVQLLPSKARTNLSQFIKELTVQFNPENRSFELFWIFILEDRLAGRHILKGRTWRAMNEMNVSVEELPSNIIREVNELQDEPLYLDSNIKYTSINQVLDRLPDLEILTSNGRNAL